MSELSEHNFHIKRINGDLGSAKTRDRGITALQAYLSQCPDETFNVNCINWMTHCCKSVDGDPKSVISACQTLRELLLTSAKFPDLKKSVSSFINMRFFEYFLKHLAESEDGWLCAEACFISYKGACGPYEGKLKEILLQILNKNIKISKTIADCYALLPSLGGGGHGSVNYKSNWKSQFTQTLSFCHLIFNQLFSGVVEIQTYEAINNIEIENASHEHLAVLLHNYCLVLGSMLKNRYPVPKPIPVDRIINLICRGLSVTSKTLGNQLTSNIISLKNLIPQIHINLYSLLSALIVTCKTSLYPYAHLICKLIKQSLEWTESDYKYGSEKPFASLRSAVYSSLCNWLVAGKSGCCAETISSAVIYAFKKDFIPQKPTVLLQGTEKAKEAKQNEKLQINRLDEQANAKLCFSALKTMQLYIKYLGSSLKREEHSELQNAIVRELMEIQCAPSSSDISIPYSVFSCRLELYNVLLAITVTPHPHYPPPTQFSLRIFSQGLKDKHPQISKFCSFAVNDIMNIIHPAFKVATFPINLDNMKTTTAVEFPKETEKSVDLVWRETRNEEENVDDEEPMEVDESVLESHIPNQDFTAKEKDLIEFSMVEINDLKNCLESPKKSSPAKQKQSPKVSPAKASDQSSKNGDQEIILESPVRGSPKKESPKKLSAKSPEKSPEEQPKKLSLIEKLHESLKELEDTLPEESPEKAQSSKEVSLNYDDDDDEIPATQTSPQKTTPAKKAESPKKSPTKQQKPTPEKPESPAKQQEPTPEKPESPKKSPAKQQEPTPEKPVSPKKSPAKQESTPGKGESPKKTSPAKPQNDEDSEVAEVLSNKILSETKDDSKRQTPSSEVSDDVNSESPVRRSTRLLQNSGEKSKSDTGSSKNSPSPKRQKTDSASKEEEASSQESVDSDNKTEIVKEPVVKLRKLSESAVDSAAEEKKYNLRSKPAAKVQEEGKSTTPRRGRSSIRSGTKSERSSSSESATSSRTGKRIAEKPKEDDIMELFDESLNPQD